MTKALKLLVTLALSSMSNLNVPLAHSLNKRLAGQQISNGFSGAHSPLVQPPEGAAEITKHRMGGNGVEPELLVDFLVFHGYGSQLALTCVPFAAGQGATNHGR